MQPWMFEEFVSIANEVIYQELLQKNNEHLLLIGGQAVSASVHPLPCLVNTTDIDIVVNNAIAPVQLTFWLDELEKCILARWKEWCSIDGKLAYQSMDKDFISLPHRYINPRFRYRDHHPLPSIKLERWMHIHNGICTTSIKVANRRLLDISSYPMNDEIKNIWESSFLKWVPCPSLQIHHRRKCFSNKHSLLYGRIYTNVRIPNTSSLVHLLNKSITLEAYGMSRRCFASSKVFASMERIRLLEMVHSLKSKERHLQEKWKQYKRYIKTKHQAISSSHPCQCQCKYAENPDLKEKRPILVLDNISPLASPAMTPLPMSPPSIQGELCVPRFIFSPIAVTEKTTYTVPSFKKQKYVKEPKVQEKPIVRKRLVVANDGDDCEEDKRKEEYEKFMIDMNVFKVVTFFIYVICTCYIFAYIFFQ